MCNHAMVVTLAVFHEPMSALKAVAANVRFSRAVAKLRFPIPIWRESGKSIRQIGKPGSAGVGGFPKSEIYLPIWPGCLMMIGRN